MCKLFKTEISHDGRLLEGYINLENVVAFRRNYYDTNITSVYMNNGNTLMIYAKFNEFEKIMLEYHAELAEK